MTVFEFVKYKGGGNVMPPYATLETMFFVDYEHFFNRKNKISAGESWRKI